MKPSKKPSKKLTESPKRLMKLENTDSEDFQSRLTEFFQALGADSPNRKPPTKGK